MAIEEYAVQIQVEARDKALRDAQSRYWMARYLANALDRKNAPMHPRQLYRWLGEAGYQWDGTFWRKVERNQP